MQKKYVENLTGTTWAHKPDGSLRLNTRKNMKKYICSSIIETYTDSTVLPPELVWIVLQYSGILRVGHRSISWILYP